MDVFVFFSLITFQVTILSIVAIVFGQSKIAEKALGSLTSVLEKGMPILEKGAPKATQEPAVPETKDATS